MNDLKAYFKLVVTAVISFIMHLLPGKRNKETSKILDFGQAAACKKRNVQKYSKTVSGCGNSVYPVVKNEKDVENPVYNKKDIYRKKVLFRQRGPDPAVSAEKRR